MQLPDEDFQKTVKRRVFIKFPGEKRQDMMVEYKIYDKAGFKKVSDELSGYDSDEDKDYLLMREVVVGIEGVQDHTGQDIVFSKKLLKKLANLIPVSYAIVREFFKIHSAGTEMELKAKN